MVGELESRRGRRASPACHRETTWTCVGQRFHSVTNGVCLDATPGFVVAPGSNHCRDWPLEIITDTLEVILKLGLKQAFAAERFGQSK